MTDTRRLILDVAIRNWWLVALAAVAGGLVAHFVAGSGSEPIRYTATAPLEVDTVSLSTQARLPKLDTVVAMVQAPEFADEIDLPDGVTLRAYTTGNPQQSLFISATAADESVAEEVAEAAAENAIEAVHEYMEPTLEAQRAQIETNEQALAALPGPEEGDETASFYRWNMEKANVTEKSLLAYLENAYTFPGEVTVTQAVSNRSTTAASAGGALAGLFLGLVLVALRELAARRTA